MTLDYLKDVLLDLPKETNAISESILNQIDTMKKAISSRAFCGEPGGRKCRKTAESSFAVAAATRHGTASLKIRKRGT